jgi:hypothetical protein
MRLKPNTAAEFTKTLEQDIVPRLRKHDGFADEITFVGADGTKAVAISLWDTKANAEAYNRTGYPEVLKGLSKVVEGTPVVSTFDVSNSTFHKIPVHKN